jgi:hypothetical protein
MFAETLSAARRGETLNFKWYAGYLHQLPRPNTTRKVTAVACHYCEQTYESANWSQLARELAHLGWNEVLDAALALPGGRWSRHPKPKVIVCNHCITTWHRERLRRQRLVFSPAAS